MSQRYEPDSLQIRFMQDVATAFAGLGIARLITYRMVAHHAPKDSKSPGTDPRLGALLWSVPFMMARSLAPAIAAEVATMRLGASARSSWDSLGSGRRRLAPKR
jgi:hypothetical protein